MTGHLRIHAANRLILAAGALAFGYAPASGQSKPPEPPGPGRVEMMLDGISDRLQVIADSHWHKGEYNHIINLSKVTLAARPDLVDVYANIGWLLWSMKRDPEAVALYEKGLKANPNSFYMYDELGQYYFVRAKNYPKAVTYYERAVKFKDVKPQTWNALARSYEKSGKLDKALKAWEKAATYPGNPAAQHNLKRVRSLVKQRPSSQ